MSPVTRKENSPKTVTTPVEIQYSSSSGASEHVVSPSRPEEQEVDYEVMARLALRHLAAQALMGN
uniref:Uncharacterized protein n=1 Tax=Hyaloperonospora arabidopsidis (strain Emoy2) TaxID=559515 RepID=M4B3D7_HYAAE